jgi:hypothetical protein
MTPGKLSPFSRNTRANTPLECSHIYELLKRIKNLPSSLVLARRRIVCGVARAIMMPEATK